MIDKQTFDMMQKCYSPIISRIIDSNQKYYRSNQTIKWRFSFDDKIAVFAWCNRTTNIITINIASVDHALRVKEPLNIEYFLLHEIRHIYQHLEIDDYKNNPDNCNNIYLAKKWCEEESNYVPAVDQNGIENKEYFGQDMEMDAFAYAFAVMKHKYGAVPYLYLPEEYQNERFNGIVNEWIEAFNLEGL